MAAIICGIDEAGRGPLAGPVYAAAVVLPEGFPAGLLDDSKKLNEKRRDEAALAIRGFGACFGVACASSAEIDKLNILRASLLAMKRAFETLRAAFPAVVIDEVVVDGLFCPKVALPENPRFCCRALVKADATTPAVMAASILAKTERDAEMLRLAALYPDYGFEQHKGYPTKLHRQKIREYGPTPEHRLSFQLYEETEGPGLFDL